jgi:N-carbamoylputrescine amidase
MTVATTAMVCSTDKEANLAAMESMIDEIMSADEGTDLIVFGETILGHYFEETDPRGYQLSIAEPIPGPATAAMGAKALEHGVNIAFGLAETDGSELYNTVVLVLRDGTAERACRKQVLVFQDVQSGYTPGSSGGLVELDGLRVGFLICADNTGQDVIEKLASEKPDIIVHPVAGGGGDIQKPIARAVNSWIIQANRVGIEGTRDYEGYIGICDPVGTERVSRKKAAGWVSSSLGVCR